MLYVCMCVYQCECAWNLFDLSFFIYSHLILIHAYLFDAMLLAFHSCPNFVNRIQLYFMSTLFALCVTALLYIEHQQHLMIRWHFCLCSKTISNQIEMWIGRRTSF